jgi:transposase
LPKKAIIVIKRETTRLVLEKILTLMGLHTGKRIVYFCDNAAYYHSKLIKEWLKVHQYVQVMYLPPYSPYLNPIERIWKLLKKEKISFWYDCFEDLRKEVIHF